MTVAASPSPLARGFTRVWSARWPIGAELGLFLVLMATYEWLRDLVATEDIARPLAHAHDVVNVEKSLGLFVEPTPGPRTTRCRASRPSTSHNLDLHAGPHDRLPGRVPLGVVPAARELPDVPQLVLDHERAGGDRLLGVPAGPAAPRRPGPGGPHEGVAAAGRVAVLVRALPQRVRAMPSMHVGYTFLFALTIFWLNRPSPWRWLAFLWPARDALHGDGDGEPLVARRRRGVTTVLLGLLIASRLTGGLPMPWRRADA